MIVSPQTQDALLTAARNDSFILIRRFCAWNDTLISITGGTVLCLIIITYLIPLVYDLSQLIFAKFSATPFMWKQYFFVVIFLVRLLIITTDLMF